MLLSGTYILFPDEGRLSKFAFCMDCGKSSRHCRRGLSAGHLLADESIRTLIEMLRSYETAERPFNRHRYERISVSPQVQDLQPATSRW
jgi:hypothetical protein